MHEAIPISDVDSVNTTARWRGVSRGPPHSIKTLPEGRYMVRVFLSGMATLYSLPFSEQCADRYE